MSKLFATVAVPEPRLVPASAPSEPVCPPPRAFVCDLVMDAMIGVYAHERAAAQRIRVNIDIEAGTGGGPGVAEGADLVRCVVGQGHVTLVETLAERLAERCLADSRVRVAKVRVEKLDVFPDAASVGVEIERSRG